MPSTTVVLLYFPNPSLRIPRKGFRPPPGPLLRLRLSRLRGRRLARLRSGQDAPERAFVRLAHLLDPQLAGRFDEARRLLGVVLPNFRRSLFPSLGVTSHA